MSERPRSPGSKITLGEETSASIAFTLHLAPTEWLPSERRNKLDLRFGAELKRLSAMGFPTYMDEVDAGAPPPFHQQFLKYRQLKDQLRRFADLPTAQREPEEQAFLQRLQIQVRDINR